MSIFSAIFDIGIYNINKLLRNYNIEQKYLNNFHQKVIKVNILSFDISLQLLSENNFLQLSKSNDIIPNLTVYADSKSLFAKDILANIKIEGDAQLASSLFKTFQQLNISIQDILALHLPPITSHLLNQFIQKTKQNFIYTSQSIANHTSEYLVHEKKFILGKVEFGEHEQKVFDLKDDVDRLEQKLNRITVNRLL